MRQERTITARVKHLSRIAHAISDLLSTVLEQGTSSDPLRAVYLQCCEIQSSAMSITEFADMASHLFIYSCFVARYYHNDADSPLFQPQHIAALLSYAHPLHSQCIEALIGMESLATDIDEVVSLLATLDRQSIDRVFQDDPLTHFYERFLHEYNPRLRASHGIYYTPQPVISYIMRSLDYLLRSRFTCPGGLAAINTNICILDPASGTGVFVQAALEHTRAAYQQRGPAELWREHLYQHFLPRLTGIEVLITPYLIAHLRLNLFLAGMNVRGSEKTLTQIDFSPETTLACHSERSEESQATRGFFAALRMTGEITPDGKAGIIPFRLDNALREPDHAQNAPDSIMIVLGNPPYAGHSANKDAWMMSLLEDYKEGCPELKKRAQAKWLSDDYVKFIRLAQWHIDSAGQGILAFITSHSYLDNPTFRGMRRSLARSFDELYVLDLHGNAKKQELAPGATRDENIFAIQSGIAISIFVKHGNPDRSHCKGGGGCEEGGGPLRAPSDPTDTSLAAPKDQLLRAPSFIPSNRCQDTAIHPPTISHAHLWGSRAEKLAWLAARDLQSTAWTMQHPHTPHYLFAPQETRYREEYEAGWSIPDIFRPNGDPAPGIITCHDEFAVAWTHEEMIDRVEWLLATSDENEARQRYHLCAQKQWNYAAAKRALHNREWQQQVMPLLYRPFDMRWTVYNRHVAVHLRERVTRHLLPTRSQNGQRNLALLIGKAGQVISGQAWDIVFCSRIITEFNSFRRGGNIIFPLYLNSDDSKTGREVNLAPAFIAAIVTRLGLRWIAEGQGDLQHTIGPEDVFSYIYALLHTPSYRARYAAFLKRDFPRIPLPPNLALFRALCHAGQQLVRLHLLEGEIPLISNYPVAGTDLIERVSYVLHGNDKTGRVWINAAQYFEHVPLAAWTLHIGGYQVCLKWPKDRRGRTLSQEEIIQYQKIVAALTETLRLMREIDDVIEVAGGWPL